MKLIYNPDLANMSYEEWKQYKIDEEKRRTHNAEPIDVNEGLHAVVGAINEYCFNNELRYIPLYYIPADLEEKHGDSVGLYGYGCIMISKPYYKQHGIDEAVINTLYHEMLHAFCDIKGIEDTDGDKHLDSFADTCEQHGGVCAWENSQYGYSNVRLRPKKMRRIKADISTKGA